jgi:GntR family transcriptional regulator/MocR family aminotransferase
VLHLAFGDRIDVEGANAGLHVVVRFADLPQSLEAALIDEARRLGVGVHSAAPLYDPAVTEGRPDRISLIMGYSALDTRQIERGVQLLAQAVARVLSS